MAQIGVAPFVLKDVVLGIAEDSYEKHVSQVQFVPTTSSLTWQGLTPDASFTDQTAATWVCNLSFAQDWETENSLSQYLLANAGNKVTMTFQPKSGMGPSFEATVTIAPGPIGGEVNTYAVGTVALGCDGPPALIPAAGGASTGTQSADLNGLDDVDDF